jgi:hypothetical protein
LSDKPALGRGLQQLLRRKVGIVENQRSADDDAVRLSRRQAPRGSRTGDRASVMVRNL